MPWDRFSRARKDRVRALSELVDRFRRDSTLLFNFPFSASRSQRADSATPPGPPLTIRRAVGTDSECKRLPRAGPGPVEITGGRLMEKLIGLSVEQNASDIALHLDQNIRDAFEQHQSVIRQEVSPLELEIYSDAAWEPSQRFGLSNRPSLLSARP
jgi:hypothetical protein